MEQIVDYRGKPRVQTINKEPSMTVQSDAHLADLNNIMANFGQGRIDMLDDVDLQYRDVSEFTDLSDALMQARDAEIEFMKLPSKVREIFMHDVAVWLDTAHDKEKRDALVEAGFLKSKETAEEITIREAAEAAAAMAAAAKAAVAAAADGSAGGAE